MKNKPNQAGPSSAGPRPAANRISGKVKAQTSFPSSGAKATKKDGADVHDARRDNQPKQWGRKVKGHQDQKDAVKQGGSVN